MTKLYHHIITHPYFTGKNEYIIKPKALSYLHWLPPFPCVYCQLYLDMKSWASSAEYRVMAWGEAPLPASVSQSVRRRLHYSAVIGALQCRRIITFTKHCSGIATGTSCCLNRGECLLIHHFTLGKENKNTSCFDARLKALSKNSKDSVKILHQISYKHGVSAGVFQWRAIHVERNLLPFTAAIVRTHGVNRHLDFNLSIWIRRTTGHIIKRLYKAWEWNTPQK